MYIGCIKGYLIIFKALDKACFQDQVRQFFPLGGDLLKGFVHKWLGSIQDPFMLGTVHGHLLHFNLKPTLIKPAYKSETKISVAQKATISLGIGTMLCKETIELGPENKGFFTYPFVYSKQKSMNGFIMNLKPLRFLHNMYYVQNDHPEANQVGRVMGSLTGH